MIKNRVLARLSAAAPGAVSCRCLAEAVGASQNAVRRAVCALRDEGCGISAVRGRGYALCSPPECLSAREIERLLPRRGVAVRVFDSVDSTNNVCRRLLGEDGAVLVCAEAQTAGRGRTGKSFASPGGGLYMSLAFRPGKSFEDAAYLTAYAAVSAARAIERLSGISCGIKWVNDLYLGGKKLCGILTEAVPDGSSGGLGAVIVGIGINLHTADIPESLCDIAVGLDCGKSIKNALAAAIADELLGFSAGDTGFMREYRERSVVIGQRVGYTIAGRQVFGLAETIENDGALRIVRDDGKIDLLRFGEISLEHIEGIK